MKFQRNNRASNQIKHSEQQYVGDELNTKKIHLNTHFICSLIILIDLDKTQKRKKKKMKRK